MDLNGHYLQAKDYESNRFSDEGELKDLASASRQSVRNVADSSQCELSFDDDVDLDGHASQTEGPYHTNHSLSTPCSIHYEVPHEPERSFFGEMEEREDGNGNGNGCVEVAEAGRGVASGDLPMEQQAIAIAFGGGVREESLFAGLDVLAMHSQSEAAIGDAPFDSNITPIKGLARHHSFSCHDANDATETVSPMSQPRRLNLDLECDGEMVGEVLGDAIFPTTETNCFQQQQMNCDDHFEESSRLRVSYMMRMESMSMESSAVERHRPRFDTHNINSGFIDENFNRAKRTLEHQRHGSSMQLGPGLGHDATAEGEAVNKMPKMSQWSSPHTPIATEANPMPNFANPMTTARAATPPIPVEISFNPTTATTSKRALRCVQDEFEHLISLDAARATPDEEMRLSGYASSSSNSSNSASLVGASRNSSEKHVMASSVPSTPPMMAARINAHASNSLAFTQASFPLLSHNHSIATADSSPSSPPPHYQQPQSANLTRSDKSKPFNSNASNFHHSNNRYPSRNNNNNNFASSNNNNALNYPKPSHVPSQSPKSSNPLAHAASGHSVDQSRGGKTDQTQNANPNRRRRSRGMQWDMY
jgi:hypothetical protein